jgi:putative acetyltransferase
MENFHIFLRFFPMVRIYQHGDHHFIGRIYHEAIHRLACRDYTKEQLNAWAGSEPDSGRWNRDWQERCEKKRPFVKVLDGRVIGFIELDPDGHIDCTFVDPDYVGQGMMDEIMTEVKREAVRLGLPKLFAEVSITARKFFERQGFVWVRDNTAVIGEIELANFIMEWKVDSE